MKEETKQKLECVADWLEGLPEEKFNMKWWFQESNASEVSLVKDTDHDTTCGTSCCIAGWAVLKKGYKMKSTVGAFVGVYDGNDELIGGVPEIAGDILGLSPSEKTALFWGSNWPFDEVNPMFPNTPKGAADRIRYFIKEGK